MKINKLEFANDWSNWVGKEIEKFSGKPFKSQNKTAIPNSVGINPNSGKIAFYFNETNTYVDCFQCKLKS